VWSFHDVTQARNLELELRQSQKMEALGRLAGGVAHDFNNLLMLISGYATQMSEDPSLAAGHSACEQILATTRRAASVTKQLLAFSRKQPIAPTVTDLNTIVAEMKNLLRRLLPEQVELQLSIATDRLPIYADSSQIELLLMNLAINARDAMPEGGVLNVTTGSEALSAKDAGRMAARVPSPSSR
jgi:signal transduction histidine kinase